MKILTVVGARPQFIKAAPVSRKLRKSMAEILVHTGQHYDENMSQVFFDELDIPYPDYNLGVGSGSHGEMTGQMLIEIEKLLQTEHPDALMVYGDTNSTLAGALAAAKLLIPVIHVEAGLRSYNMEMPEEQNRVITDHLAHLLLCPTNTAVENLAKEGVTDNVYNTGDVMCDAILFYKRSADQRYQNIKDLELSFLSAKAEQLPEKWILATIHRAENTNEAAKIEEILEAFEKMPYPVIFPVHPRTRSMVLELNKKYCYKNILLVQPVSYLEMIFLTSHAQHVITDSGGLQKECYILRTPCVTIRDQTEWVETLQGGHNVLSPPETTEILHKVHRMTPSFENISSYYGDGHAAEKIVGIIEGGVL